jgi:hypothetical protein
MLPSTEIRPTRLELSDSSNEPETMATNFSVSSKTPQFGNNEKGILAYWLASDYDFLKI